MRETLPTFSLERVARAMERENGSKPTEMAVLLTAARDTLLDLAKAQLFQTQQVSSVVHAGMMKMISTQAKRLKELEGDGTETEKLPATVPEPLRTVAETLDDTSSSGSDSDSEDEEIVDVAELSKLDIPDLGTTTAHQSYCHPQ